MCNQRHAPAALLLWKRPVPIVEEAGWAPGSVWTGAENVAPIGIRSPDRPALNESLYRLSYPSLFSMCGRCNFCATCCTLNIFLFFASDHMELTVKTRTCCKAWLCVDSVRKPVVCNVSGFSYQTFQHSASRTVAPYKHILVIYALHQLSTVYVVSD